MLLGCQSEHVRADFVGRVAIDGDAIRSNDYSINFPQRNERRCSRVSNERCRDAAPDKLSGSQP